MSASEPAYRNDRARAGSPLTPQECQLLERIPETGAQLLGAIPRLEEVVEIIEFLMAP